jgi:uncharacterized protein
MKLTILAQLFASLALQGNPVAPGIPAISQETEAIVKASDRMSGDEILTSLKKLSDAGDESAEILTAEVFNGGLYGVKRDAKKACDIFEGFIQKYGEAAHNFATCLYQNDGGRQQDFVRARTEYANAIAMGWPDAPCALGNMMIIGQGGPKDINQGLSLCLQSAEAGVAHAQTDYGTYYLMGKIVPKDAKIAYIWLQKAADQKHANASYLLAQMYQKGDGITSDKFKAAELFAAAYKGKRFDAAYHIAMINASWLITQANGKTQLDTSYLAETMKWLEIAVKVERNPDRQKNAAELLKTLLQIERR